MSKASVPFFVAGLAIIGLGVSAYSTCSVIGEVLSVFGYPIDCGASLVIVVIGIVVVILGIAILVLDRER